MESVINVGSIIAIQLFDKKEVAQYTWMPKIPSKRYFFGLLKKDDGFIEGFYECGEYKRDSWTGLGGYTEIDYLIEKGYIVDMEDKKVFKLPYIQIRLSNKDWLNKSFPSIKEANLYISKIESASKNRFERIKV